MYLSRLLLNPRSFAARRDLSSPYQMHASLYRAFADPDREISRFLWRLEPLQKHALPKVLVQSAALPNWDRFASEDFSTYLAEAPEAKTLPLEHLEPAQVLRFRLKANPTVTRKDPETGKTKRHGLRDVEEQLEWLARQGSKGGFAVSGAMVARSERVQMHKHGGGTPITVQSVLYEGHLKITDLEDFKRGLAAGFGHAKALGFGLLSIARG